MSISRFKKLLALILSILIAAGVYGNPLSNAGWPGSISSDDGGPGSLLSNAAASFIAQTQAVPAAYASQAADGGGVVADPNLTVISPRNVNYTTDVAFIGSLERNAGFDARLNYPSTISILIPREGMFVSMAVSGNEWVEEGDPLAVFSVVANDLEIDESQLALELAESAFRRETDALGAALDEARARLEVLEASINLDATNATNASDTSDVTNTSANTSDSSEDSEDIEAIDNSLEGSDNSDGTDSADARVRRRAELAVDVAAENLDFAIYTGERNLDRMRDRLNELIERSKDFTVYAPISGFVYDLVYFSVGRSVPRGQFICRISNPDVFQIFITAPNLTQLRLGAPVAIETSRRDAPTFPGRVIGNTALLGRNESDNRAVIAFDDPQAFLDFGEGSILRLSGLRYRIQIQQADIQNVLLVPRRAVSTESSYRFVNILEDGLSKKRYVLIGLTNVEYAQVLDGLEAGDTVIIS